MAPSTSKSINEGSQQYPYPSNVDVASYVKIKLHGQSNYVQWKEQMLSLIDEYNMRGFIDGTIKEPQMTYGSKTRAGALAYATKLGAWKKSDTLVRKWILGSLSKDVRRTVDDLKTAKDIWNALESEYNTITHENSKEDVSGTGDGLQTANDICNDQKAEYNTITHENSNEKYPYPTHVNAASFVSIKLSGESNYRSWSKQMRSLVFSHDMIGFINGNIKRPQTNEVDVYMWERSDVLVQGWIYGSLSEDVMATISDLNTAHDVWMTLKKIFAPAPLSYVPNEFDKYIKLRKAIDMGDWEKAQVFFNDDKKALIDQIDQNGNTALRIAICNQGNILFLDNLVNIIVIDEKVLHTLADALRYAIVGGNKVAVQMLVHKYPRLLFVDPTKKYDLPLLTAAMYSQRTIFYYLFKACRKKLQEIPPFDIKINPFEGHAAFKLLNCTISAGFFDVAYYLVKNYSRRLKYNQTNIQETLCLLAEKRDEYQSAKNPHPNLYLNVPIESCCGTRNNPDIENQERNRSNLGTWKSNVDSVMERIYVECWKALRHVPYIKCLHDDKVKRNKALTVLKFICEEVGKQEGCNPKHYEKALILAVENDIPEVIQYINEQSPDSVQNTIVNGYTLFELSIKYRSENVYNYFLIYNSVTVNAYFVNKIYQEIWDSDIPWDYNLLHIAGKLAPQDKLNKITGAALQMQWEFQWFQEVAKLVPTNERDAKNKENETPIMVFKKEHEDLRKNGEEWMKSTANSYTITAILIVTIVFAAAITVPGGTNGDTGKAVYKTKPSFIVFIVSDAISLFTSTISLLLFLSILTARYAEEDFLKKLPRSLIYGLCMLFVSVTTMLIAFSATLYIMYGQDNSWILIIIFVITCLPIGLFVMLQLPLLMDLIYSTYGRGTFANLSALRIAS